MTRRISASAAAKQSTSKHINAYIISLPSISVPSLVPPCGIPDTAGTLCPPLVVRRTARAAAAAGMMRSESRAGLINVAARVPINRGMPPCTVAFVMRSSHTPMAVENVRSGDHAHVFFLAGCTFIGLIKATHTHARSGKLHLLCDRKMPHTYMCAKRSARIHRQPRNNSAG